MPADGIRHVTRLSSMHHGKLVLERLQFPYEVVQGDLGGDAAFRPEDAGALVIPYLKKAWNSFNRALFWA